MVFYAYQRFLPHAIQIWKHRITSVNNKHFIIIIILQFEFSGNSICGDRLNNEPKVGYTIKPIAVIVHTCNY